MGVDVLWIGDDFGMQNQMLISPQLFREFFKPRYAQLFAKWKVLNPALKIAFHSDGNIFPIIPDLIEIGLDILNPVQPKSMDPAKVKERVRRQTHVLGNRGHPGSLALRNPRGCRQ